MKLLVLCLIILFNVWLVIGYESEGDVVMDVLPWITCQNNKDCKTKCKEMKDREACSSLTFCHISTWSDELDSSEIHSESICIDQKDCTKDSDCTGFLKEIVREDGAEITQTLGRKCEGGKCVLGMGSSSLVHPGVAE